MNDIPPAHVPSNAEELRNFLWSHYNLSYSPPEVGDKSKDLEEAIRREYSNYVNRTGLYAHIPHRDGYESGRFRLSYMMATYGDLKALDYLLHHTPDSNYNGGRPYSLLGLLPILLPIPEDIELRDGIEPLQSWFDEHKDRLIWDEALKTYLLRSSR